MSIHEIERCGVVGAGGAGFPTHVKVDSKPDTVIMNAAECEPLLHKDMELILNYTDQVMDGMRIVMDITGAKDGIIGIKEKHPHEIELLNSKVSGNIRVVPIEDVYPAGDEVTLIHMTTGRLVNAGALPISEGCVVNNVESLYNIGTAMPVVEKFVSIAGAVEEPATVKVPIGTTYAEILEKFNITSDDYVVRAGGLMMGDLEDDLNTVVSKRTGALIVLPADHHTVKTYKRFETPQDTERLAKASCDQCSQCTELCPRYILGQPISPSNAMRNRMFSHDEHPMFSIDSLACCECNLCTMYSCPEGLDPRGSVLIEKGMVREQGLRLQQEEIELHPMQEFRKVSTYNLMKKLDVLMFKDEGPLKDLNIAPKQVRIPLNQHIGAPAQAVVSIGQQVKKYDLIAKADGKVSSNMHASIDGVVTELKNTEIIIQSNK